MIAAITSRVRCWQAAVIRYPQHVFLAYALPSVLALALLTPPMFAPDEGAHVMRAYAVSALRVVPAGLDEAGRSEQQIPADMASVNYTNTHQRITDGYYGWRAVIQHETASWRSDEIGVVHNAEGYFPLYYVPQAVVIRVAWLLDVPIIDTLRYGRIVLGLLFVAIGFVAIRLARWGRLGLLTVLGLPMTIFLGASFSPDAWLIAGAALVFAFVTRWKSLLAGGDDRAVWSVSLLTLAAGALRPGYVVMNSLWVKAAFQRLGLRNGLILLALAAIAVIWSLVIVARPERMPDGIDPQQQLAFLLENPAAVFGIAWNTLSNFGTLPLRQVFIVTDHPNAHAGDQLTWILTVLVLAAIALDRRRVKARKVWTWVILASAVLAYGLTYGAMYLAWTPVGSYGPVLGVQGRYFIPILLFALAALPSFPMRKRTVRVSAILVSGLLGYFFLLNLWAISRYFALELPA